MDRVVVIPCALWRWFSTGNALDGYPGLFSLTFYQKTHNTYMVKSKHPLEGSKIPFIWKFKGMEPVLHSHVKQIHKIWVQMIGGRRGDEKPEMGILETMENEWNSLLHTTDTICSFHLCSSSPLSLYQDQVHSSVPVGLHQIFPDPYPLHLPKAGSLFSRTRATHLSYPANMWHLVKHSLLLTLLQSWTARRLPFYPLNRIYPAVVLQPPFSSGPTSATKFVGPQASGFAWGLARIIMRCFWISGCDLDDLPLPTICAHILCLCVTWLRSAGSTPLQFHISGSFDPSKGCFLLTIWMLSLLTFNTLYISSLDQCTLCYIENFLCLP